MTEPIKIFRGDDTDFIGNKVIEITLDTDIDLSGITADFLLCGFKQHFDSVTVATKRLEVVIGHEETKRFPLGRQLGTLVLKSADGKIKHVDTQIEFFVTNKTGFPMFCGDEQIKTRFGLKIKWDDIRDTPTTLEGYGITDAVKSVNGKYPDENGNVEVETGGGGTTDYNDLKNKPSINGITLSGNKTAADLGLASAEQGQKANTAYQKPQGGIPASDMTQDVQASLGKADTALQTAPVASVNGKTGAVVLTASDIGAKPTQTAVPDPSETGSADEFISNIGQTTNGVIIPVKKKVDFSKVATHALPFSLPEQFFPVDVWVPGGVSDLYVTIRDSSLLTVVPNETGGGPYMLQYYNPDPDAADDLRGYIGLAVFDYNLEFVRTADAGTLDFNGHNPYTETVYLVAGGGGLSLLGTLVQHRLGYIPLDAEAVADAYDATSTYSVGDIVTHDGRLYECNTAISSPEAWDATHWTEKKVGAGGDFSPLSGRNFDFATTQGVMDALKATIEALGGTVTNAPTTPAQNNQTQGE